MASKIVVNLDTSKESYLVTKCKQNDDLVLEAFIYENGLELDLTNKEITIQALKADGTYIIQNTNTTKLNNKITANLDRDFTRVPGVTKIEIVLTESSRQNTTFSFLLEVVGSVIRGAAESFNTVTILENLQNKIVEAGQVKAETEQLIQSGGAATQTQVNNLVSQMNDIVQQKAEKTALETEKARIDNLVANAGDVSNNAELLDIRIGADGNTYANAGESIRSQANNIKKDINNLQDTTLYTHKNIQYTLGFINTAGQNQVDNTAAMTTDFIFVRKNSYLNVNAEYAMNVAEYNNDKTLSKFNLGVKSWKAEKDVYIKFSVRYEDRRQITDTSIVSVIQSCLFTETVQDAINNRYVLLQNLFDFNTVERGKVVSDTGIVNSNDGYVVSDFIPVEQYQKYTFSSEYNGIGFITVAAYDQNKSFIQRFSLADGNTIFTRGDIKYFRANCQKSNFYPDKLMIVKGEELPQNFIKYNLEESALENKYKTPIIPYFEPYIVIDDIEPKSFLVTEHVYALYDGLISQYPDYITKEQIGIGTDGIAIYMYTFAPKNVFDEFGSMEQQKQKAILISGEHGEYMGIYCLFNALKTICIHYKENVNLARLRFDCIFKVIPVVNGWANTHYGIENGINLQRVNGNGVNINRNYFAGFSVGGLGTSDYSGVAALSEPETQAVDKVMRENLDAKWFTSFHNYAVNTSNRFAFWIIQDDYWSFQKATQFVKFMSGVLYKEGYEPINTNSPYFGYADSTSAVNSGTCTRQSIMYGIDGNVLELNAYGLSGESMTDVNVAKYGTTIHLNWILANYFAHARE